jgi:hypothetical protein
MYALHILTCTGVAALLQSCAGMLACALKLAVDPL